MANHKIFPPEIIEHTVENYFTKQNTKSKLIYLSVIIAIFSFLLVLPLIKIDITTQSRGIIRSSFENNQLFSAVYAEVTAAKIKENMFVNKGDTLLLLKTDKIDEQIKINQLKIKENNSFIKDLSSLVENKHPKLKTNTWLSRYLTYKQKFKGQELIVRHLEKEFELDKQFYDKKMIARVEFEKKQNSLDLAKSKLALIKEQQLSEWQAELVKYQLQNKELLSNVKQLEKEKEQYIITAPITGTITQYSGIKPGNYTMPNQSIAQISPAENLIVECYVQPKDIGLIRDNMEVSFQLDAFNYNQWGSARGKVVEISEDIINIDSSPAFKVRCKLLTGYLELKNGYKGKLKKGMTLTSRFKLIRRSLFDLLYDKTDNWLNPKMKEAV
jgi:membrane fusion protein, peptide pheromone/bacteriocin exporter